VGQEACAVAAEGVDEPVRTFSVSTSDFPNALPYHLTVGQEVTLTVRCKVVGLRGELSEVIAVGGRMPDGTVDEPGSWFEQRGLETEFVILGIDQ
jgi:hypothetical protein